MSAVGSLLWSVSVLILSVTLLLAGNSLQFVILSQRAEPEGFALSSTIGLLTAGCYVGYAPGLLQAPRLVAALSHIRVFAGLAAVVSTVVRVLHFMGATREVVATASITAGVAGPATSLVMAPCDAAEEENHTVGGEADSRRQPPG